MLGEARLKIEAANLSLGTPLPKNKIHFSQKNLDEIAKFKRENKKFLSKPSN